MNCFFGLYGTLDLTKKCTLAECSSDPLFNNCHFLGEALLVTSGLVLYFGDFLACTIAKVIIILFSFI